MEVTVSIPDGLVPAYTSDEDLGRQMVEAYAIEEYRQEKISLGRLRELLDLSIDEANVLLKQHDVPLNYAMKDLEEDHRSVQIFLKKLK